jgi:hypothetical protein
MHLVEIFFHFIGVSHQRTLPDLIHSKLESAMGEILTEKMGEKFLDAESKNVRRLTRLDSFSISYCKRGSNGRGKERLKSLAEQVLELEVA